MGTEFQFYKRQRVMWLDGGNGCTFLVYLIFNCRLKLVKMASLHSMYFTTKKKVGEESRYSAREMK